MKCDDIVIDNATVLMLKEFAERYETVDFLDGDPSWWMHQVDGDANREAMAFIASALSYGSRRQFMPKIGQILEWSGGDVHAWVRDGAYRDYFRQGDRRCFYRLYDNGTMRAFLDAYRLMLMEFGTMGCYVGRSIGGNVDVCHGECVGECVGESVGECVGGGVGSGVAAVEAICAFFAGNGACAVVPKDARSACKRICMFLRWMVRDGSPVDLGLWSAIVDKRTLAMPLDTHVLSQSVRLGLATSRTATMSAAVRLAGVLSQVFPDDPLRGDFALFGYGVGQGG